MNQAYAKNERYMIHRSITPTLVGCYDFAFILFQDFSFPLSMYKPYRLCLDPPTYLLPIIYSWPQCSHAVMQVFVSPFCPGLEAAAAAPSARCCPSCCCCCCCCWCCCYCCCCCCCWCCITGPLILMRLRRSST